MSTLTLKNKSETKLSWCAFDNKPLPSQGEAIILLPGGKTYWTKFKSPQELALHGPRAHYMLIETQYNVME